MTYHQRSVARRWYDGACRFVYGESRLENAEIEHELTHAHFESQRAEAMHEAEQWAAKARERALKGDRKGAKEAFYLSQQRTQMAERIQQQSISELQQRDAILLARNEQKIVENRARTTEALYNDFGERFVEDTLDILNDDAEKNLRLNEVTRALGTHDMTEETVRDQEAVKLEEERGEMEPTRAAKNAASQFDMFMDQIIATPELAMPTVPQHTVSMKPRYVDIDEHGNKVPVYGNGKKVAI